MDRAVDKFIADFELAKEIFWRDIDVFIVEVFR